MKHRMHENSVEAFGAIEDERSERAELIYQYLARSGASLTDRQIMQALGFTDMNAVRPRCSELIDSRWLIESGTVECPVTGKRVRRTRALNAQERADLIAQQRARWEAQRPRRVEQPELNFQAA